jgi:transposase
LAGKSALLTLPWVVERVGNVSTPFPVQVLGLSRVLNCRAENGVQNATLWRALLGVEKTVVEDIEFDEDEQLLVAHVRPRARARTRARCGRCERRSPAYDRGEGRRRWRALDLGTVQVVLEADAPRVNCPEHGPTVAALPWARHAAGHTLVFDEQVAWLATQCSKSAVHRDERSRM